MKRSEINRIIREGIAFLDEMNIKLPPFFYWKPIEWMVKGEEYNEIRDCMLGWDVTDYGSGEFKKTGLLAMTIRNGIMGSDVYPKVYAEKLIILEKNQIVPMHFHHNKVEDIINRGGGDLVMELYNADQNNKLANTPVNIQRDGRRYAVPAGTIIRLKPGESITYTQRLYHKFWVEGKKTVLGEVSMVNDDKMDNFFLTAPQRFSHIEEDEHPEFFLCNEYA